jgi:TIR domain
MGGMKEFYTWCMESGMSLNHQNDPLLVWRFFSDDLDDRVASHKGSYKYDVFISYSREERAVVEDLVRELQKLKKTAWFDSQVIGDPDRPFLLYRSLHAGIASSRTGVAIISKSFLKKKWPTHESQGLSRNGKLMTIVTKGVDRIDVLEFLNVDSPDVLILNEADLSSQELASQIVLNLSRCRQKICYPRSVHGVNI